MALIKKSKTMAVAQTQPKQIAAPTDISRVATALAETKGAAVSKRPKFSKKKKNNLGNTL
jgi:hypothetical protein